MTSSDAGSCSCLVGLVIAAKVLGECNFTPAGAARPTGVTLPWAARVGRCRSPCSPSAGRAAGCSSGACRCRSRATEPGHGGRSLAVVVPARDEAPPSRRCWLGAVPQLAPGDELVVVDDHSTDATAAVAPAPRAPGSWPPPTCPTGWAGKPWACHDRRRRHDGRGAGLRRRRRRRSPPAPSTAWSRPSRQRARWCRSSRGTAIERPVRGAEPALQPHRAHGRRRPSASLARPRARPRLAYGPVLVDRPGRRYEAAGGHGHPEVRGAVAEDLALARVVGRSLPFAGRGLATFRMYPHGVRALVQGWTKNIATGARSVPWWAGAARGRLDLVARRRAVRLVVVLRRQRRPAGGAGSAGRPLRAAERRSSTPCCWCSSSPCSSARWCSRRRAVRCGGEGRSGGDASGRCRAPPAAARHEDVLAVEAQLVDALADVVEGAVGAGLVAVAAATSSGYQRLHELLHARHVDASGSAGTSRCRAGRRPGSGGRCRSSCRTAAPCAGSGTCSLDEGQGGGAGLLEGDGRRPDRLEQTRAGVHLDARTGP